MIEQYDFRFVCLMMLIASISLHSRAETDSQNVLSDYEFLLSLDPDSASLPASEWQFTIELNDTGIEDDNELRERFSLSKTDWLASLDYFALDFETDSFDRQYSVSLLYDSTPLVGDWYLSAAAFYNYDRFENIEDENLQDILLENERQTEIDDISWGAGAYAMNLVGYQDWLLNWGFGIRWEEVDTDDLRIFEGNGKNQFALPGIKLQLQTLTDSRHQIQSYLAFEWNEPSLADTKETSREFDVSVEFGPFEPTVALRGKVDIPTDFQIFTAQYDHRIALDQSLISQASHQLRLRASGQFSFSEPLLPSFQRSIGGVYSTRGYDDSVLSGDKALDIGLEYRWLIPQFNDYSPWLFLFVDWASVNRYAVVTTIRVLDSPIERFNELERDIEVEEASSDLSSLGVGLDVVHHTYGSLYLAVAQALDDDEVSTEAGDIRLHAYLRINF